MTIINRAIARRKQLRDMDINGRVPSIKVGLGQINNSFSNQSYLPLSVGMLQAYLYGKYVVTNKETQGSKPA
jgi:hypothetical protein